MSMGCILLTKSCIRERGQVDVFVSMMDLVHTKNMGLAFNYSAVKVEVFTAK